MKLIFVFLLSFTAYQTHATEQKWIESTSHKKTILVSYAEESRYFVEKFELLPGEYQEKTFSKVFSSEAAKDKWLKSFLNKNTNYKEFTTLGSYQISATPQVTDQSLWIATESWNWEWEKKYADWISINGTTDFFQKYNIETDCADVAYAYRWIFAYIHKLPMGNQLAGSQQLITHMTFLKKWQKLPRSQNWWEDRAFLAALDYLLDNTYTHSLISDSYPIQISTDSMLPGVHHLDIRPHSGHTLLLVKTNFTEDAETLTLIYSNVPRMVRELYQSGYWYETQPENFRKGGFVRMRWLEKVSKKWQLVQASKHPYYSLEQYQPEFMQDSEEFYDAVQSKLNAFQNSPIGKAKRLIHQIVKNLYNRQHIVVTGQVACKVSQCQPGDENYEAWSTPSRDARILEAILKIELNLNQLQDPTLWSLWNELMAETLTIYYDEVQDVRVEKEFSTIIFNFKNNLISHDPRDSTFKRWGFADPTL